MEVAKDVVIYGIIFQGKVVYIGQTNSTPSQRFRTHRSCAARGENQSPKLYRHMRRYSNKKYAVVELEQCSHEESAERERYWIEKFNTLTVGLNTNQGKIQSRGHKLSEEFVSGRKEYFRNLKEETPEIYTARMANLLVYAKKHNREVKAKAIVSSDGREFAAISDACGLMPAEFSRARSDIRRALKTGIQAFGVYWRYADKDFVSLAPRMARPFGERRRVKPVVCLSTGKEWACLKDCAKEFGVPYVTIQKWLAQGRKPQAEKYRNINVAFKE